jgi:hypothetical protein
VKKHRRGTEDGAEPKLFIEELRHSSGKRNRLKDERLFRPRRIIIELLPDVKGIGVILHELRPVPINR